MYPIQHYLVTFGYPLGVSPDSNQKWPGDNLFKRCWRGPLLTSIKVHCHLLSSPDEDPSGSKHHDQHQSTQSLRDYWLMNLVSYELSIAWTLAVLFLYINLLPSICILCTAIYYFCIRKERFDIQLLQSARATTYKPWNTFFAARFECALLGQPIYTNAWALLSWKRL